ncbi:MAG: type II toxin-antitoxin system PemK/MazF family toxin [Patescibacteria group bacterium]
MEKHYYPKKGEIIWCKLDPIAGHEQAGTRPCLVISGSIFNVKTGLAVVCPLTSSKKEAYYFRTEVKTSKIKGFIMVDQLRTIDWSKRFIKTNGQIPSGVLSEVYKKIKILFGD